MNPFLFFFLFFLNLLFISFLIYRKNGKTMIWIHSGVLQYTGKKKPYETMYILFNSHSIVVTITRLLSKLDLLFHTLIVRRVLDGGISSQWH